MRNGFEIVVDFIICTTAKKTNNTDKKNATKDNNAINCIGLHDKNLLSLFFRVMRRIFIDIIIVQVYQNGRDKNIQNKQKSPTFVGDFSHSLRRKSLLRTLKERGFLSS